MLKNSLDAIIEQYAEPGVKPVTADKQRERLHAVAELAAQTYPGDFVEIGAYCGDTTAQLLDVARKYGRRVLVVDPWQKGTQNCHGGEYEKFLQKTAAHADLLDVVRLRSDDPAAIAALRERALCCAYVDGLHTEEAAFADALNVAHAGLIVMDDIRCFDQVRVAFGRVAAELEREPCSYYAHGIREGYLLLPEGGEVRGVEPVALNVDLRIDPAAE